LQVSRSNTFFLVWGNMQWQSNMYSVGWTKCFSKLYEIFWSRFTLTKNLILIGKACSFLFVRA
jgi:hypothetical protein